MNTKWLYWDEDSTETFEKIKRGGTCCGKEEKGDRFTRKHKKARRPSKQDRSLKEV